MPRVCVYPELWPKCMRVLQGTRSVGTVSNVLSVWHNQHLCSCLRVDSGVLCTVSSVQSPFLEGNTCVTPEGTSQQAFKSKGSKPRKEAGGHPS